MMSEWSCECFNILMKNIGKFKYFSNKLCDSCRSFFVFKPINQQKSSSSHYFLCSFWFLQYSTWFKPEFIVSDWMFVFKRVEMKLYICHVSLCMNENYDDENQSDGENRKGQKLWST